MKKPARVLMILAATALTGLLMACSADPNAPAQQSEVTLKNDGLGGISGWQPIQGSCSTGSLNPLITTNTSGEDAEYSITVNKNLAVQVFYYDNFTDAAEDLGVTCAGNIPKYSAEGYTADVTVPAGQTSIVYLSMGGSDDNLIDGNDEIAIGAGSVQWYDFKLKLNPDEGFDSVQLNYEGTGGYGGNDSVQVPGGDTEFNQQTNAFNVVACDPSGAIDWSNPSTTPTPDINTLLSPMSTTLVNGQTYGANEPICFTFLN